MPANPERVYTYNEIAEDEIRLLELQAGDKDTHLECKLNTYRLEVDFLRQDKSIDPSRAGSKAPLAPKYDAISYTWGHEAAVSYIKIYDQNVAFERAIRPNLEAALRNFRTKIARGQSKLFWIDALCMNQENEVEKSQQIEKMAEIYSQAELVRVWLGEDEGDSVIAVKFISRLLDLDVFEQLTRDPVTDLEWAALLNLMRRPWFSRRWIVQEIGVARQAVVHCGSNIISWDAFAEAISLFTKQDLPLHKIFKQSSHFKHHPDYLGEMDALGAKILVDVANNLFRKDDEGTVFEHLKSLEALMSSLTVFEASDPKDTVYAILWLSHDARPGAKNSSALSEPHVVRTPRESPKLGPSTPATKRPIPSFGLDSTEMPGAEERPSAASTAHRRDETSSRSHLDSGALRVPRVGSSGRIRSANDMSLQNAEKDFEPEPISITVDYKLSLFEVYKKFVEFVIDKSKSLDIICRPWASQPLPPKPGSQEEIEPDLPSWIPSISGKPFELRPIEAVYSRVAADALVGTTGVGARNYNACGKTRTHIGPFKYNIITDRTLHAKGFIIEAIDHVEPTATWGIIPPTWREAAGWTENSEIPEDFWRTLVADRASDGQKPPPPYFRGACKWAFSRAIKNRGVNTSNLLLHGDCNSISREFLRRVQAVVWERRLILSEARPGTQPLLGLVPSNAMKGDVICILYGCSVPVILRKKNSNEHNSGAAPPTRQRKSHYVSIVEQREASRVSTSISGKTAAPRRPNGAAYSEAKSTDSSAYATPDDEAARSGAEETKNETRARTSNGTTDTEAMPVPAFNLPNSYIFIGECYIHGMMSGEAFKYQKETEEPLQEFLLV